MELQEKIISFVKEHMVAVIIGVIGVVCLGYGMISMLSPKAEDSSMKFQSVQEQSDVVKSSVAPVKKEITIDIEGAVQKPGVYKLPADDRIQDVLIAAGGLGQDADRQRVAQTLNLATPLTGIVPNYIFLLLVSKWRLLEGHLMALWEVEHWGHPLPKW